MKHIQADLFPNYALPDWLPNETLYSLSSRYHRLSCSSKPFTTSKILFGGLRRGSQHDFPSGLDYFVTATGGRYGTIKEIIDNHTILPFYSAFKNKDICLNAVASMSSPQIGSLKYQLGILTSKFGANHPLKACTKCIHENKQNYSTSYWHIDHQLPGVWICLNHKEPLLVSMLKATGINRFDWILPDQAELVDFQTFYNLKVPCKIKTLLELARISFSLLCFSRHSELAISQTLNAYYLKLTSQSLMTEHGSLRLSEIGEKYYTQIREWQGLPFSGVLPKNKDNAKSQIGRLLRTPRPSGHPLWHVLLISFLFNNWNQFYTVYKNSNLKTYQEPIRKNLNHFNQDKNKSKFLALLKNKRYSITKAALESKIDISTGMGWALEEGISSKRRSKKLTPSIIVKMTSLIEDGYDKEKVARECDISVVTVSRFLRSDAFLFRQWKEIRFVNCRNEKREKWVSLNKKHPAFGVKALRLLKPDIYTWLYRHDRSWFTNFNLKLKNAMHGNNSKINWADRDIEFSKSISELDKIIFNSPTKRTTLSRILQFIPDLKAKIKHIDRLPLTHKELLKRI